MKTILFKIIKIITLLLSWLVIPPLFYYLHYKWYKLFKCVRRVLIFLSPIILLFNVVILFFLGLYVHDYLYRGSHWDLKKTTEISFPRYTNIDQEIVLPLEGYRAFQGDFNFSYQAQFNPIDSAEFYKHIEEKIKNPIKFDDPEIIRYEWYKSGNDYCFSLIRQDPDYNLDVTIKRKSCYIDVGWGEW